MKDNGRIDITIIGWAAASVIKKISKFWCVFKFFFQISDFSFHCFWTPHWRFYSYDKLFGYRFRNSEERFCRFRNFWKLPKISRKNIFHRKLQQFRIKIPFFCFCVIFSHFLAGVSKENLLNWHSFKNHAALISSRVHYKKRSDYLPIRETICLYACGVMLFTENCSWGTVP